MTAPFFPTLVFGWAFFAALVGILLVSSWVDLKRMVIPKWLTLPALAMGLAVNVVRGGMLGLDSSKVWLLEADGFLIGALDGALFAGAGFATAFGLFFIIWIFGACGGGDVKLCAAVGAWIGPGLVIRLLIITILIVPLFMAARVVLALLLGNLKLPKNGERLARGSAKLAMDVKPQSRLLVFSPPLALATAVLLLWTFRGELQLATVGTPTSQNVSWQR